MELIAEKKKVRRHCNTEGTQDHPQKPQKSCIFPPPIHYPYLNSKQAFFLKQVCKKHLPLNKKPIAKFHILWILLIKLHEKTDKKTKHEKRDFHKESDKEIKRKVCRTRKRISGLWPRENNPSSNLESRPVIGPHMLLIFLDDTLMGRPCLGTGKGPY